MKKYRRGQRGCDSCIFFKPSYYSASSGYSPMLCMKNLIRLVQLESPGVDQNCLDFKPKEV